MSSPSYVKTDLYGGAITANLPENMIDISNLRQVPDHQEVRVQRDGLSSIVFDILERVAPPSHDIISDEAALHYHFADVVSAGHTRADVEGTAPPEETRVIAAQRIIVPSLGSDVSAWNMCATQHPARGVHSDARGQQVADFTGIMLTLVRLERQETDLVIAVNVPHMPGEYDTASVNLDEGCVGPLMEQGMAWQGELLRTLRIADWGLFVTDDD